MKDRRFIDSEIGIRSHRISCRFVPADQFVECIEMRFEISIEIPGIQNIGINMFGEFRIIDELRNLVRTGFQQKQGLNIGTE